MPSTALQDPALDPLVEPASAQVDHQTGLFRSASVLSIGNAAGKILGLVREIVIAYFFGASGEVSAYRVASQVPTLFYDFLVGGMLSAAMVPVLSDYARPSRRAAFARLASVLLTVFAVLLAAVTLLLMAAAPWVARLLAGGFVTSDPSLLPLTANLIRLAAPAVWLLSMAGVFMALLYALQRFSFPALAAAVFNLGIIVAAPLLADRIGVTSLVIGLLAGSLVQLALMAYDFHRAGFAVRLRFEWQHPALRRMLQLYLPIALGLLVSIFQIGLDRRLASGTGEQSIAWMSNATTLQQMPLGLISVAIALASLPMLSQHFAAHDEDQYRRTLGQGLRLVLFLIVPAAVVLWVLGEPITRLLFQRNQFTAHDTEQVVAALNIYVVGMLFAAIDFPLNYAFYARNNTLLPALVGVLSVGVYIVVAFGLVELLGYLGLVWADSAKQASHALVMVIFLALRVGPLHVQMGRGLMQIGGAALGMGVVTVGVSAATSSWLPTGAMGDLVLITLAGGAGLASYVAVLRLFKVPEMELISAVVARRLLRRKPEEM